MRDAQHLVGTGHDLIGKTGLADRHLGIGEVWDGAIPQFAALEPLPFPVNRYDPSTWHGLTLEEVTHLREAFFPARLARAFFINDQNELGETDARGPLTHNQTCSRQARRSSQHLAPNARQGLIAVPRAGGAPGMIQIGKP